ncbi:AraC family transcriptional regulator [Leptospira ognonensis]|uniref:AraC family transcriptional regulator n=1 Tax=Leptospira ognonensis TaxID=2484945 RepID=A0A4R9KAD6_9LEPT|nr:helix-turn-helix domain-containing protein [Leptospira ognonensis]TGL62931.1 AraC family transcriptional regulator [Leptospira ognonensis]
MFFKAPNPLSPFLKEIWHWKQVDTESLPWILPSYEFELVFHLTSPPYIYPLTGEPIRLPLAHWVGPQNKRWKIVSTEKLNLISIRFQAGSPYELFKESALTYLNRFPSIENTSFSPFLKLSSLVSESETLNTEGIHKFVASLTEILESYLGEIKPIDANVSFAFHELTNATAGIYEIAKKTGISRKQLERGMKQVYGLPPGELRKMHRILAMIRNPNYYKSEKMETRFTDLAYDYGYTDQSHLIRDFKSVTGYLPKDWFKNFEKMSYFYNS